MFIACKSEGFSDNSCLVQNASKWRNATEYICKIMLSTVCLGHLWKIQRIQVERSTVWVVMFVLAVDLLHCKVKCQMFLGENSDILSGEKTRY